jgi:proline iminopeptidase
MPEKTRKRSKKVVADSFKGTKLYPPIEPIGSYFIKVSELHTVAYWTYGNPNGLPVVFVHGGPGGTTSPDCARFFDPKAFFIVLVDQRRF